MAGFHRDGDIYLSDVMTYKLYMPIFVVQQYQTVSIPLMLCVRNRVLKIFCSDNWSKIIHKQRSILVRCLTYLCVNRF